MGQFCSAPKLERYLNALTERGIREDRARRILLDVAEDQEVLDQLEYGDSEIARRQKTRDPIANPPGFYIYLVETNYPIPKEFETSRKRELKKAAADRDHTSRATEAERELRLQVRREEYRQYRETEIDRLLHARFSAAEIESKTKEAKTAIARERPDLRLPEPAATEFAIRRIRESFAETINLASFDEFCCQVQETLPL